MGKIKHYGYTLLLILGISCQNRQERIQQVLTIREMGELATTEYSITKIVKASDDQTWYKIGDRKILISVEATLKAGIDLQAVKAEDISIDGKKITLVLPPPKLISLTIPPDKIKVAYEEVGMLRTGFDNAERDALLAQAEKQIYNAAASTGIFTTTEINTRQYLTAFLEKLGYEQIMISFGQSTPRSGNYD
ncbi:DUF4230 domain-containing protein [Flavihumibacter fluvii]|uniref:DUF4230 domain-containing protein n=1 Tax=Flavihumibacter fluvii TaxID=2838157 RepID=UPI001BDE4A81|nr:DUF4230 domain-containing protein [Flavihumibacter fluvii]ULQ54651.1 DUF4230 domain-containing protein [Flavihumibacter fluvii]